MFVTALQLLPLTLYFGVGEWPSRVQQIRYSHHKNKVKRKDRRTEIISKKPGQMKGANDEAEKQPSSNITQGIAIKL